MKKYQHDCDHCEYLGTYLEHDVYICQNSGSPGSIIARYGDDGPNYISFRVDILHRIVQNNEDVEVMDEAVRLPFREFIFSQYADKGWQAIFAALTQLKLKELSGG